MSAMLRAETLWQRGRKFRFLFLDELRSIILHFTWQCRSFSVLATFPLPTSTFLFTARRKLPH